jgi:hypothetical protein
VSVVVHVHGAGFVVQASDRMSLHDAVEISHPSQDHREFVKLAATIQDPQSPRKAQLTFNFDHILLDSVRNEKRSRIVRPPGSRLRSFADFFFSPKTMERVINPILSDMYNDHCGALAEGKPAKAFWARVRGYWSFWKALGFYTLLKNAAEIWKISKSW